MAKKCNRCDSVLQGSIVSVFKNGELVEEICRNCNLTEDVEKYIESGTFSHGLLLTLSVLEVSLLFGKKPPFKRASQITGKLLKQMLASLERIRLAVQEFKMKSAVIGVLLHKIRNSDSNSNSVTIPAEEGPIEITAIVARGKYQYSLESDKGLVVVGSTAATPHADMGLITIDADEHEAIRMLHAATLTRETL